MMRAELPGAKPCHEAAAVEGWEAPEMNNCLGHDPFNATK